MRILGALIFELRACPSIRIKIIFESLEKYPFFAYKGMPFNAGHYGTKIIKTQLPRSKHSYLARYYNQPCSVSL